MEDNDKKLNNDKLNDARKIISKSESNSFEPTIIYPFIDEMVDTFYNDQSNALIERAIESRQDKSIFMMYVMMYFGIHLKLERENDEIKKEQIKVLMTDLVRDPEKRKFCIELFENRFHNAFVESSSASNKNLLLDNKKT
jgi:hypothetical protein